MKLIKRLLLIIIIPFLSFGQGFIQSYGTDDEGDYAIQRNDGGYAFIGWGANASIYFNISDSNGDVIVESILDDYYPVRGSCIQQTLDNGYVILGKQMMDNLGLIYKFDNTGNLEWLIIDEEIGRNHIAQTTDGGYITIGNALTKIDSNGSIEWSNPNVSGREIQQTDDGGYIIASPYNDYDYIENTVYRLIKTNSEGLEEWIYEYNTDSSSWSSISLEDMPSVQQTDDMGFITIISFSYQSFGEGFYGTYLIKIDQNGNQQWIQEFSSTGLSLLGQRVRVTADEGFIIAGGIATSSVNFEDFYIEGSGGIWLLKLDSYGVEQWSKKLGDTSWYGVANSIEQTTDNGYIIAGTLEGDENYWGNLMIKTDSEGNINSTSIVETPTIKKNLITTADILGRETNNNEGFQLHIYDDGSVEKKYLIK